LRGWIAIEK